MRFLDEHASGGLMVVAVSAILISGGVDLLMDVSTSLLHQAIDLLLVCVALGMVTLLWLRWNAAERREAELRKELAADHARAQAWEAASTAVLYGLAQAIDAQCRAWGLTPAERHVAFELLKGRQHKRIAADTHRSETTVRQHAASIYHKSGLGGRAQLAAYFLGALQPPATNSAVPAGEIHSDGA